MCGRYTLSTPADLLGDLLELSEIPELVPRFNIAPTQEAPVARADGAGGRRLDLLRWGLVPFWAREPEIGNRMINARAETVADKPAYRASFKRRRCLVLADGFFEWQKRSRGPKQPFFFRLRGGRPFTFAGLWDRWEKGGDPLETFTILTTEPNRVVAPVHQRMPVILRPASWELWLDPEVGDRRRLAPLLAPLAGEDLESWPVSTFVNSPGHDSELCVEPLAE